jgi:7,8-didemethyl-8-hydroxy-5-deazariboflavin synthase CofG subunit
LPGATPSSQPRHGEDGEAVRRDVLAKIDAWLAASASQLTAPYPEVSAEEAAALLSTQWNEREHVLRLAAGLRDLGLERANRAGIITYSKKAFLPITNLCRDRCHYCTFVETPQQLNRQNKPLFMPPERVLAVARQAAALGCKEALFTLGDRPEARWPEAQEWLAEHGYGSTLEYVRAMADLVLTETGMLPHLNPGVLTLDEINTLRPVAASLGMMLETTSTKLWSEPGQPHFGSPDKEPAVRLRVLDDAGLARVAFTSGILVGIGETQQDRAESLIALRDAHTRHGHLQEIIVQNFRAKPATAMQSAPDLDTAEFITTIAVARLVMGPDMRIQAPPNLADQTELELLLAAGIDDWGGVSPLTADHVNPERPWPAITELAERTADAGFLLHERLTAYPPFIADANQWIDPHVQSAVFALVEPKSLLADEHARVIAHGQQAKSPDDSAVVTLASWARNDLRGLLRDAAEHPESLSNEDYARLLDAETSDLETLCELADDLRRYTVGETVSYVTNRTLDLSRFERTNGYTLDDLAPIAEDASMLGLSELCVQGVTPLDSQSGRDSKDLVAMATTLTAAAPDLHLHAFRPAEVVARAQSTGQAVTQLLEELRAAGVRTMPGTGVKVLNEELRQALFRSDLDVPSWIETITLAHHAGIRSTSVLGYGFGESGLNRVEHLRTLLAIHAETSGFTECVLLPAPAHPHQRGPRRRIDEHRAMHAVTRLMLNGRIPNIQVAWPRHDLDTVIALLRSGANDLGGTLNPGHALAQFSVKTEGRLDEGMLATISKKLSRSLRQRDTVYADVSHDNRVAVAH